MYDSKRKKNRTTTKIKRKITIHSSVKIRYYKYVIINLQFITLIIEKGAKEKKKGIFSGEFSPFYADIAA